MPKNYRIGFQIDDALAQAAFKRGVKGFDATEKAALRAAKAMEGMFAKAGQSASTAGAAAQAATEKMTAAAVAGSKKRAKASDDADKHIDIGLHKLQVTGIDFNDKLRASAVKSLAAQRTTALKATADSVNAKLKAMDVEENRAAKMERAKESAALGPMGRLALVKRRHLTDEQVMQAAMVKATDAANSRAVRAAMQGLGETKDSFGQGIASAFGLSSAATAAGVAVLGIGAAAAGVKLVTGAMAEARAEAERFGKTNLDFMVKLRPLASVMGKTPNAAFAKQVATFGVKTAMGKDDAAEFLESFAGRAQITKGKQISDAEYDKFTVSAGKMATARGIPKDIAGDLFASVLKIENFQAKGQGAREATGRSKSLFDILDAGSGKMAKLAPQAQELMASLASENELEGVFRNAGEVGVMTSLMAENKPEESAVFGRATIKALSQFGDKKRQPFYARAGIKPGMPALDRVQRANKVFEEEVGKGRPMESVLEGFGLAGDVREKTGLATAFKARNTVLAPQLERMKAGEGEAGAKAAEEEIARRSKDEDVQYTKAGAMLDRSQLQSQADALVIAKKKAEAQLVAGGMDSTWSGVMAKRFADPMAMLGGTTGRESLVTTQALRNLQQEAGLTANAGTGTAVFGSGGQDAATIARELRRIADSNEAMLARDKAKDGPEVSRRAPDALPGPPNGQPRR